MSLMALMDKFKGFCISKFMLIEQDGTKSWVRPGEWKALKEIPGVQIVRDENGTPVTKQAVGIHYKDEDEFHTYWIDISRVDPYKE